MATIVITIIVSDIDNVLATPFDKIKIYRSTTTVDGVYTELTTSATRITLLPLKTVYQFIDTTGDEAFFYKTSYFDTGTLGESTLSDAAQGESKPALDILSPQELIDFYLFGLDLTNDEGVPYPDPLFTFYIEYAVSWAETVLDIQLTPKVFNERHDFYRQDYYKYIWLQTDETPLISVDEVKLVLPTEQEVITFLPEWINFNKPAGQVNIVPGNGQLSVITLGQTGAWLPLIYGWTDFIPDVFRVQYTAGFEKGKLPTILKELVGKKAAFGPLNIAGDLLGGAGIASQSISLDGLSQSFNTTSSATNAGYGARLLQYEKEIKATLPTLRNFFHPIALHVA